jgi:hypothetical protein
LNKFHLQLNIQKTRISDAPEACSEKWVRQLRNYQFRTKGGITQILDYLDLALEFSKETGEYSPFRYAIKRSMSEYQKLPFEDCLNAFRYISSVTFLHPYIIDCFDELIERIIFANIGHKDDFRGYLRDEIDKVLKEYVPQGKSDVITISLYLANKYQLAIKSFPIVLSSECLRNDPIPMLLAFKYAEIEEIDQ